MDVSTCAGYPPLKRLVGRIPQLLSGLDHGGMYTCRPGMQPWSLPAQISWSGTAQEPS